jgi:rhodanese-related sulfurtransferase
VTQIEWSDLERLAAQDTTLLLDVRNPGEIARSGQIATNAVNIPLDDLRARLEELPRDKHLVVSCASGQRPYYACRILAQHGFDHVDNLDGAYMTFHAAYPEASGNHVLKEDMVICQQLLEAVEIAKLTPTQLKQ